jgi:hypothetical protein
VIFNDGHSYWGHGLTEADAELLLMVREGRDIPPSSLTGRVFSEYSVRRLMDDRARCRR